MDGRSPPPSLSSVHRSNSTSSPAAVNLPTSPASLARGLPIPIASPQNQFQNQYQQQQQQQQMRHHQRQESAGRSVSGGSAGSPGAAGFVSGGPAAPGPAGSSSSSSNSSNNNHSAAAGYSTSPPSSNPYNSNFGRSGSNGSASAGIAGLGISRSPSSSKSPKSPTLGPMSGGAALGLTDGEGLGLSLQRLEERYMATEQALKRAEERSEKLKARLAYEIEQRTTENAAVELKATKIKEYVQMKVKSFQEQSMQDAERIATAEKKALEAEQKYQAAIFRAETAERRLLEMRDVLLRIRQNREQDAAAQAAEMGGKSDGGSAADQESGSAAIRKPLSPPPPLSISRSRSHTAPEADQQQAGNKSPLLGLPSNLTSPSSSSSSSNASSSSSSTVAFPSTTSPFAGRRPTPTNIKDISSPTGQTLSPPGEEGDSSNVTSPKARSNSTSKESKRSTFTDVSGSTPQYSHENMEKSGYLVKQGGKVKSWKRRFFVLKERKLFYFKTEQAAAVGEILGCISLSGFQCISSCQNREIRRANVFEIETPQRIYYLSTETRQEMNDWIQVLQNVLKRSSVMPVPKMTMANGEQVIMEGWLIKQKHGFTNYRWFVLQKGSLLYFKAPTDSRPIGRISLDVSEEATVEVIDNGAESDPDEDEVDDAGDEDVRHRFLIKTRHAEYYMIAESRDEMEKWVYHLKMECTMTLSSNLTETERLIVRMKLDEDPSGMSADAREALESETLKFTRTPISSPLTKLASERLNNEAINMFKAVLLYTGVVIDQLAIDYHVTLVQNLIRKCLKEPDLRNEFYCQLIKQTTNHPYPNSALTVQCWQLLALCCGVFPATRMVRGYLQFHLERISQKDTEAGRYAAYSLEVFHEMERRISRGAECLERSEPPSRLEVMSIISLLSPVNPMSIQVQFYSGQSSVVAFGPQTSVSDIMFDLASKLNLTHTKTPIENYGLYYEDPYEDNEVYLSPKDILGDILSRYEVSVRPAKEVAKGNTLTLFRKPLPTPPSPSGPIIPRLVFRLRLMYPGGAHMRPKIPSTRIFSILTIVDLAYVGEGKEWLASTVPEATEIGFYFHQANREVVQGRFPITQEAAVSLAALQAQVEWGDHYPLVENMEQHKITSILERFYPQHLKDNSFDHTKLLSRLISDKWAQLRGLTEERCMAVYMANVAAWQYFGVTLFECQQKIADKLTKNIYLAIKEEAVMVIDSDLKSLAKNLHFSKITSFGESVDQLFYVVVDKEHVNGSEKLQFVVKRAADVVALMASYKKAYDEAHAPTPQMFNRSNSSGSTMSAAVGSSSQVALPTASGGDMPTSPSSSSIAASAASSSASSSSASAAAGSIAAAQAAAAAAAASAAQAAASLAVNTSGSNAPGGPSLNANATPTSATSPLDRRISTKVSGFSLRQRP